MIGDFYKFNSHRLQERVNELERKIERKDLVIKSLLEAINTLNFKVDIKDDEKLMYVAVESGVRDYNEELNK